MTRRAAVLIVSVTMLVVAVPVASAAVPPNACAVLHRADIEDIVDASVKRSQREQHTPKSASICNWNVGGSRGAQLVSVWVQRGKPARQGFDVSERVFGLGSEALPQFGRLAFYSEEAGAAYVLRGSTFLYVQRLDQTGGTDPATLRDQAVELTDLALERV
jgi:hypothetical protein